MNHVSILFRTSVRFTRRSLYCDSNTTLSGVIKRKLFKSWAVWHEINSQSREPFWYRAITWRCCFGNWRTYRDVTRSRSRCNQGFCEWQDTRWFMCLGWFEGGCNADWYRPVWTCPPPVPYLLLSTLLEMCRLVSTEWCSNWTWKVPRVTSLQQKNVTFYA